MVYLLMMKITIKITYQEQIICLKSIMKSNKLMSLLKNYSLNLAKIFISMNSKIWLKKLPVNYFYVYMIAFINAYPAPKTS